MKPKRLSFADYKRISYQLRIADNGENFAAITLLQRILTRYGYRCGTIPAALSSAQEALDDYERR